MDSQPIIESDSPSCRFPSKVQAPSLRTSPRNPEPMTSVALVGLRAARLMPVRLSTCER
jgi:hypothetical protein